MGVYEDSFPEFTKFQGINSRDKGCKNENNLCKYFLQPWTNERFARTPSSGGLQWKSAFSSGDVVNIDRGTNFEFVVETKHYADLTIPIVLRSNSLIFKFWRQVDRDTKKLNNPLKHALLAVRENGMKKGEYIVFFDNLVSESLNKLGCKSSSAGVCDGEKITGYSSREVLKVNYKILISALHGN